MCALTVNVTGEVRYDKDKLAAYQTLYVCLETVSQLAAPIAPFYMDRLFTRS